MARRTHKRTARDIYWANKRTKRLRSEGFAEREITFLAARRISTPQLVSLRRRRKSKVNKYMDRGLSFMEAIEAAYIEEDRYNRVIESWEDFRRLAYWERPPTIRIGL